MYIGFTFVFYCIVRCLPSKKWYIIYISHNNIACGLISLMSSISVVYLCSFCLALIVSCIVHAENDWTYISFEGTLLCFTTSYWYTKRWNYYFLHCLYPCNNNINIAKRFIIIITGLLSNKHYFPTFVSLYFVSAHAFSVANIGLYMHSFVFVMHSSMLHVPTWLCVCTFFKKVHVLICASWFVGKCLFIYILI